MPEIGARDLRRLEALEGRLQKTRDARTELAAERRELRNAVKAGTRRIRELEKQLRQTGKKLEATLAENAALASQLEAAGPDLERLRAASLDLRAALDTARAELEGAKGSAAEAREASAERDALAESLALAREQLAGKSIAPVLPPKEVARLVEGLVAELGGRLPGMSIRDGELQLKVAVQKVGRKTGFVVPSAESPPELRDSAQAISIRFARGVELPDG